MSPVPTERVSLPTGYWVGDRHHREVRLRGMTGADEELVVAHTAGWMPVERVTSLLARCVCAMDGRETVDGAAVDALTVGDREALLLHLRRLTLGERMQCTLSCPRPECGEAMDLDLRVGDLLVPATQDPARVHVLETPDGARIRFRLPTGADQRAAARAGADDPDAGVECLLRRCVERPDGDALDAEARERVTQRMSELDPQAELILALSCPQCGHRFSTVLDAASVLLDEVAGYADALYRQVHVLASTYHWGEAEILGLETAKRHGYLRLVADEAPAEGWA